MERDGEDWERERGDDVRQTSSGRIKPVPFWIHGMHHVHLATRTPPRGISFRLRAGSYTLDTYRRKLVEENQTVWTAVLTIMARVSKMTLFVWIWKLKVKFWSQLFINFSCYPPLTGFLICIINISLSRAEFPLLWLVYIEFLSWEIWVWNWLSTEYTVMHISRWNLSILFRYTQVTPLFHSWK